MAGSLQRIRVSGTLTAMGTRVLLALAAVSMLSACDTWPLHAHLPDPYEEPLVVPFNSDVAEDVNVAEGDLQDLGQFIAPSTITISGELDSCGWDGAAEWPAWPEHPVDIDGDGQADIDRPWSAGWFTGDVDQYAIELDGGAWVWASMTWENAPADGLNAPYQPPGPGPWQDESDLDLLLFDRDGDAADQIVGEGGFGREHPATTGADLVLSSGDELVFAVGCHHGVPSTYSLTVTLDAL